MQRPTSSVALAPSIETGMSMNGLNGIVPMRRGRPTKANVELAPPSTTKTSSSSSSSNPHTEWQVPNTDIGETDNRPTSPVINGFGDSFAPPVTIREPVPIMESNEQPGPLVQSKTAAATAALFEELSTPGSTIKAQPTLASLAAARSQGQTSMPQSSISISSSAPSRSSYGPVRRITPTKPLGPRPQIASSYSSKSSSGSTNLMPLLPPSPVLSKSEIALGSQTDEAPVINGLSAYGKGGSKPRLVSRGSQTSPALLGEWKKRDAEVLTQQAMQAKRSEQQPGINELPKNIEKSPSMDDSENVSVSGVADSLASDLEVEEKVSTIRNDQLDLLGDIDEGSSSVLSPEQLLVEQPESASAAIEEDIKPLKDATESPSLSRSPSEQTLPLTPSSDLTASNVTKARPELPRDKFKPIKRDSPAVQRQSTIRSTPSLPSSPKVIDDALQAIPLGQDDLVSEDPSPSQYTETGRTMAKVRGSRPNSSTGNFDLQPALNSIERFAPSRQGGSGNVGGITPPILAPKPERAGLRSMVSRYETMSTGVPSSTQASPLASPSLSSSNSFAASSSTQGLYRFSGSGSDKTKPIKLPKPGSLPSSISADDFKFRYPSLDNNNSNTNAVPSQTSLLSGRKQPFKPLRDSSSTTSLSSLASQGNEKEDESGQQQQQQHNEGFSGVASLRDRWQQNIALQKSGQASSRTGKV